ncbi:MAG: NFACT family protein [Candidatus ainarchaeum sp.]|nr:NFACT family protein [Candidatus ainarchaeum sp.]
MQIPNLTLAYAVAESRQIIETSMVRKVQELENNWLKAKLHSKQGQKDLIIAPQALFLSDYSIPAKQSSSGFGGFLRKHLEGKKILKISQQGFDRVVFLEFQDFFLILELFAKGNVILADKKMKILGVLHREEWKDRTLQKGSDYKASGSKGTDPLDASHESFLKFSSSEFEIVKELVKNFNIAPVVAEEALLECGIPKDAPAKSLSQKQFLQIAEKIREFYTIDLKKIKPVIAEKNSEQLILPFEFASAKTTAGFGSLQNAFEEFFSKEFFGKEAKKTGSSLEKKLSEFQKSLSNQLEAKTRLGEKAALDSKKGEALFTHYIEVKKALEIAREARGKISEKDIMYKMRMFSFVKSVDSKKSRLVVELD